MYYNYNIYLFHILRVQKCDITKVARLCGYLCDTIFRYYSKFMRVRDYSLSTQCTCVCACTRALQISSVYNILILSLTLVAIGKLKGVQSSCERDMDKDSVVNSISL